MIVFSRKLIVLLALWLGSTAILQRGAIAATPATADGKTSRQWLSAAAQQFLSCPSDAQFDPFLMLDPIVQLQTTSGDSGGANQTAVGMESRVEKEKDKPMYTVDLMQTISADLVAGRTASAQSAINVLANANGAAVPGTPAIPIIYLARMGQVS